MPQPKMGQPPIVKFQVDEITEGTDKGKVAIKLVCSPEFSRVLLGYLQTAVTMSQKVTGLMGAFGMK
jgi:hypothetical protein